MDVIRGESRTHPRPALVLALGLVVAGFLSALLVLRAILPPPRDNLSLRLAEFAEHKDAFDLVFVGSSHVKTQISPKLFDEVLAARGISVRSANLGVMGLDSIPLLFVTREIASQAPRRLRWILIDPENVVMNLTVANMTSARIVLWHEPRTVWITAQALWCSDTELDHAFRILTNQHARPLLMNVTNLGLARAAGERILKGESSSWSEDERLQLFGPDGDGFLPYEVTPGVENQAAVIARAGAEYLHSPRYTKNVQSLARTIVPDGPLDPPTALVLGEIDRVAKEAGIQAVFVLGPSMGAQERVLRVARAGIIGPLLVFNRPDRYPELYAIENRLEHSHLNATGAKIYTRHLAEQFADIVEAGERTR